jgi:hypothetical protein
MTDDDFESRVYRFEQARRLREPAEIADHLGPPSALSPPERFRLLVELICIDLEYRWRDSAIHQPIPLEGYLQRFPELGSLDRLPLELIAEEYRCRCRWGDRPKHQAILARFRDRLELILAELIEVDADLDRESAPSLHESRGHRPRTIEADEPKRVPAEHLLSDRDFLLRRLIGAGKMGKVYEAIHQPDGRKVAVKFLRKSFLSNPQLFRRFVEESRTIARLRHPNIVGTEGLGRTSGGSYFIVMELVEGPDLARLASQRIIGVGEALGWMISVCDALEYAHAQEIIHCDLKPANLLLDAAGQIKVTDFGFARSVTGDHPWALEIEGTVPFMAPEQASPCWGSIDLRTDIYGIGALLFTLLTGRAPFLGRRLPDILAQVISATPVIELATLRPDLPRSLSDFCLRSLAKEQSARFPNVRELRSALEDLQTSPNHHKK